MPWHRQLRCLVNDIQNQFEAEADIFAAEAFFFGTKFDDYAKKGEFGLNTAKMLADEYRWNRISRNIHPFCRTKQRSLLFVVWSLLSNRLMKEFARHNSSYTIIFLPGVLNEHIATGVTIEDKDLLELLTDPSFEAVNHKISVSTNNKNPQLLNAESFSNSYNVFTRIYEPKSCIGFYKVLNSANYQLV